MTRGNGTPTAVGDLEEVLLPQDEHDLRLRENTHPSAWRNPAPEGRYNLVVVGAGTAGLVAAAGAAGLGAKVALVERRLMGGDCLNHGCVPSKALIRSARAARDVLEAEKYGVRFDGRAWIDFPAVMQRMRKLRAGISRHDSASRFRSLGVDVYLGDARFTGPDTIDVGGTELRFARACIATGARPVRPAIPGLAEAGFLTNETVFTLTELPGHLAVLGGGPIGCELAQAFARFGSEVHLVEMGDHVLGREDPDAAAIVHDALVEDGVRLALGTTVVAVRPSPGRRALTLVSGGRERTLEVDAILVGVGRAPNVQGMGLEAAGVAFDERQGVQVDDRLRTTNSRIFAAGDVCSRFKFTHAADAMARVVLRNALFFGRAKASALNIPWCTYTDPEVAHVGMYEKEAADAGVAADTILVDLASVDRAVLDGEETGFLKVLVRRGGDQILGATLVSRHAGETISEITAVMAAGRGMATLAETIHPYPTQAEVVKRAGDAWNRTRLTPGRKRLLERLLAWRR